MIGSRFGAGGVKKEFATINDKARKTALRGSRGGRTGFSRSPKEKTGPISVALKKSKGQKLYTKGRNAENQ